MHKRDYLVKQFEEFAKVMAVLFGLKKEGNLPELEKLIKQSSLKYSDVEIEYAESIDNDAFIETLINNNKLNDEQLKMLGDLLYEKAECYVHSADNNSEENCYKKAKIIYLFLKENATLAYSLDMHYKIEVLSKMGF